MIFRLRPPQTWMPWNRPRPQQPAATPATPTAEDDLITQLKELAELHDTGALTDEEFGAAKAKLLDN